MLSISQFMLVFIFLFYFNKIATSIIKGGTSKPNVLFIIIDDMRHLNIGEINLHNIQKLAGKGITFENAYAQQALCAPSRNSLLTGRRPDSLRLYDFNSYWRDVVGNFESFPQLFKQHGYSTYSVGKVFHPGASSNFTDDYPYSWTEKPFHPPSEGYKNAAVCGDKHTKKDQKNLICPIVVKKQPDATLPDIETINYAIDILINRSDNQPFLLAVGLHKPHIPLKYPKKYKDSFPIHTIQPPKYPYKPKKIPLVSWHPWIDVRSRDDIKKLNISFPFGKMPDKWTLKIKQSYYAALLYIDNLVGKLLEHVNTTNTIVVLTSDHGWSLGENGLWAKYSNFNVALKVPLIFTVPGIDPKIVHSPVELVDIFPTLSDLAGLNISVPKCKNINNKSDLCHDGKSLVPIMLKNKLAKNQCKVTKRYFSISQYPRPSQYPKYNSDKPHLKDIKIMGYSIKTKRYRYTEWINFNSSTFTRNWNIIYGAELYDHLKDAEESNNVYSNYSYDHIKKYLSNLLRTNVDDKDLKYQ